MTIRERWETWANIGGDDIESDEEHHDPETGEVSDKEWDAAGVSDRIDTSDGIRPFLSPSHSL